MREAWERVDEGLDVGGAGVTLGAPVRAGEGEVEGEANPSMEEGVGWALEVEEAVPMLLLWLLWLGVKDAKRELEVLGEARGERVGQGDTDTLSVPHADTVTAPTVAVPQNTVPEPRGVVVPEPAPPELAVKVIKGDVDGLLGALCVPEELGLVVEDDPPPPPPPPPLLPLEEREGEEDREPSPPHNAPPALTVGGAPVELPPLPPTPPPDDPLALTLAVCVPPSPPLPLLAGL